MPKDLYFAGERIQLPDSLITLKLLEQFKLNSFGSPHWRFFSLRAKKYFDQIVPILKKNGVPEDFKYVPLMESNFSDTTNYKGARGFWQMMKPMAETFGLTVNDTLDERSDVKKSTEAVCAYLAASYKNFGSWTHALASLNYGTGGLQNILKKGHVPGTIVNAETTEYLFRLLAFKELCERPGLYGFNY